MRPLLVCAAYPPELRAIPASLREARGVAIGIVGIGAVAAGIGTARLLSELLPKAVVLVGTAGAYPGSGLPVGSVVTGRDIVAIPAVPKGAIHRGDPALLARLRAAGARAVRVGTTMGVTARASLARTYGRLAAVEHLESYGVAEACRSSRIGFACVLGISNAVGPRGHAGWKRNEGAALAAVAEVLERAFRRTRA